MTAVTRVLGALLVVLAIGLATSFTSATAATQPFGPRFCLLGSAAGQCDLNFSGLASHPATGNLYVADLRNARLNEFTPWGEFVRSWGWGVDDGSKQLQTCTTASGCQAGLEGGGAGQFSIPTGVAIDSAGNIYVEDPTNRRIQKFSPAGTFLLAFGGDVVEGGASGTGVVTSGSKAITSVATTAKAFRVGQHLQGTGIAPGTTIESLAPGVITLSSAAGPAATGAPTNLTVAPAPTNTPVNETQKVTLGSNTTGGTFTLNFAVPVPSPSEATTGGIPFNATAAEVQSHLENLANLGSGNVAVSGPAGGPWTAEFKGTRFADTDVVQLSVGTAGLTVGSGAKSATVASANAAEVCSIAAECRTGTGSLEGRTGPPLSGGAFGVANGQFAPNWSVSSTIAIGPSDEIFVGDSGRVQVFNAAGVYQRQLPIPQPGVVGELAVDPISGDLYLGYLNTRGEKTVSNIFRINSTTGAVVDTLEVEKPAALATDAVGNAYVFDQVRPGTGSSDPTRHGTRVLKFDPNGALVESIAETPIFDPGEIGESRGIATGSFCFEPNSNGLYIAARTDPSTPFVQAYGPHPDPLKCAPPQVPPSITAQFASAVASDSATIKAKINPHYFTDALGTTTYRLQWATASCVEDGGWAAGCVINEPLEELESEPVDADLTIAGIILSGLSPDTRYAFRFIAEGTGQPGEVIGVGGKPGTEGEADGFTTYPTPTALPPCQNDAFRPGPGEDLPDCRAYELVSPVDKAGGDIQARLNLVPFESRMDQASLTGDDFTYSSYRPFGNAEGAPFSSQYLAQRHPQSGWSTEPISPPQEGEAFINPVRQVDNAYRAFNDELDFGWLQTDTEPVLGPGGVPGHANLYRRANTNSSYGGCTTQPPQMSEVDTQMPQLQGIADDGSLGVFRDENKLTDDASEAIGLLQTPILQVYACSFDGAGSAHLRLVSVLPDGTPSELENTVGGPANQAYQQDQGRTASLDNAVSADGSKVFWTASDSESAKFPGALYVRLNPGSEPTVSGACNPSEPAKACTRLIAAGPARFWTAAEDGSAALYSTNTGLLNEYVVATQQTTAIATKVLGVLGASEDASLVYFLSEEASTEQQSEGAVKGSPNLYLYDKGSAETSFIAMLTSRDATQEPGDPGPINPRPPYHTSHVTPDGRTLAFMSSSPDLAERVAGYDNTDQVVGTPAAEIYRFQVGGELACVSCNRTGQRPRGREIQSKILFRPPPLPAGSMLPPWLNSLYAPRVLSADGNRIFFEAFEPLVLADTNGKSDVYQWELVNTGSCTEAQSAYDPKSNGCVSLITSGTETTDSQFVDASPAGDDVFIRTAASLVSWDPDQIDIYDARVNGGFAGPPPPSPPCEGESCQNPAPPPNDPTPASAQYNGPGNVKQPPPKCPKGKHKVKKNGKTKCVKNKKKNKGKKGKGSKRAAKSRGAGR